MHLLCSVFFLVISLIQLTALLLAIYLPRTKKNDSVSENYINEMKKSFKYLINNKMVLAILFSSLIVSMIAMPVRLQLPIIARRLYMISPGEIGLLLTLAGIGAVFGTLMISTIFALVVNEGIKYLRQIRPETYDR